MIYYAATDVRKDDTWRRQGESKYRALCILPSSLFPQWIIVSRAIPLYQQSNKPRRVSNRNHIINRDIPNSRDKLASHNTINDRYVSNKTVNDSRIKHKIEPAFLPVLSYGIELVIFSSCIQPYTASPRELH